MTDKGCTRSTAFVVLRGKCKKGTHNGRPFLLPQPISFDAVTLQFQCGKKRVSHLSYQMSWIVAYQTSRRGIPPQAPNNCCRYVIIR